MHECDSKTYEDGLLSGGAKGVGGVLAGLGNAEELDALAG